MNVIGLCVLCASDELHPFRKVNYVYGVIFLHLSGVKYFNRCLKKNECIALLSGRGREEGGGDEEASHNDCSV